jgi:hypothetical protein
MVRVRRGEDAAAELKARWKHEIAVAIQRRKAAMIRAVLPARTLRQEWLAQGGWPDGERQLPSLHPEGEDLEGAPPLPLVADFVSMSLEGR